MVWSPLGQGLFTGDHPRKEILLKTFNQMAAKYSCHPSQIPIAWLNQLPCKPVPVIGSTQIERIIQAKDAMKIALDREDWYLLLEMATGKEVA